MTLKEKILEHKKNNPEATFEEIATLLSTSKTYVYQIINGYKSPRLKSRDDVPTLVHLTNQISFMEKQILTLRGDVYEQEAVAKGLRQQNRGLSNVITYLESKLGIDEIDARLTKD
jgi:cyanate lyase